MEIRYYTDPDSGLPHIYSHGVTEAEVEHVLRYPAESRSGDRDSRVYIGRTTAGRCLKVIGVPDADGEGLFVVTAYDVVGKPLAAFRRRMKRRGKR